VYSKFRKNKISKKIKSPNSMRNGRFDTSKYRGKLDKMGVLCTNSPIIPGPFSKLPNKNLKKIKKIQKKGPCPGVDQRSPAGCGSTPGQDRPAPFLGNFSFFLPSTFCASSQLLLVGSSTCPPCPKFT
jgi:hypothetical protein